MKNIEQEASYITPRNTVTLAFCLVLIFFTFTWNLPPSSLYYSIVSISERLMTPLGLYQNWHQFAGDASGAFSAPYTRVRVIMNDGTSHFIPYLELSHFDPSITPLHGVASYAFMYWPNKSFAEAILTYLCKNEISPDSKPRTVQVETAYLPLPHIAETYPPTKVPVDVTDSQLSPYTPSTTVQCQL